MPILRLSAPALALVCFSLAACGGSPEQVDRHASPTSPTGAIASRPTTPGAAAPQGLAAPAFGDVAQPTDIRFPPRNEPYDFRVQLESVYRDGLRRAAVLSYVDPEGSVVWTQEYLRYRLNGCQHADATGRVLAQIDGGAVAPVCGAETPSFPPRDQLLEFRVQLEAKYRDALRRPATSTFVDVEGDIVWTQEYLRYRVSGCGHGDATARVFAQIEGRGVQPDCRGGGLFTGSWSGIAVKTACTQSGDVAIAQYCEYFPAGVTYPMTLTLSQSGSSVSGSVDFWGLPMVVSGTVQGDRVRLGGSSTLTGDGLTLLVTLTRWEATVAGASLSGSFEHRLEWSILTGAAVDSYALASLTRAPAAAARSSPIDEEPGTWQEALRRLRGER